MKKYIEDRNPRSQEQLETLILKAWDKVSLKMMNNCIDHLCNIIPKIIENQGAFMV